MKQFAGSLSKLWACKVVISSYQPPTASPSGNTHFTYGFQNSEMTIELAQNHLEHLFPWNNRSST